MAITQASTTTKLRGGYYTPKRVAEWLAQWAIRSSSDRILEPSCGDGAFLAAALAQLSPLKPPTSGDAAQVVGIELVPEEARKARARAGDRAKVVSGDFFEWLDRAERHSFDVVLGNPPFIRYQSFPEPSRTRAMQFMHRQGLRANRLTNIWVPFVVGATRLLREGGRLAMVLPAELLQVSYAAQLRQYLADSFARITIFACNEMFFDDAEQEVVLLAAEEKLADPDPWNRCDIALVGKGSVDQLLEAPATTTRRSTDAKFVQHGTEKWLKYFLDAREISFMRALRQNPNVGTLAEHATVDVGVVTGKNEFFVVSRSDVQCFELADFVVPLVARSAHLAGAVLNRSEHRKLAESGKRVYLLHVSDRAQDQFTAGLRKLIVQGERSGFHRGYKCRIRDPWYQVPAVWEPDCFFFRQIYDFPRVVLNKAGATSTDTIHRMKCRAPAGRVAANLYTHISAASAEIEGRSYGGGVLELEPTEAERLLMPVHLNGAMPIDEADALIRRGELTTVLEQNDRAVLQNSLGLSQADCSLLRRVWSKMRDRRRARRRH